MGALTNLEANQELGSTLIVLRKRYEIRKGATRSSNANGRMDKMLSWKSKVKSKPPRQLPAYGPKVSSTCLHDAGLAIAVVMVSVTRMTEKAALTQGPLRLVDWKFSYGNSKSERRFVFEHQRDLERINQTRSSTRGDHMSMSPRLRFPARPPRWLTALVASKSSTCTRGWDWNGPSALVRISLYPIGACLHCIWRFLAATDARFTSFR